MPKSSNIKDILSPYLPEETLNQVEACVVKYGIQLIISRSRNTKLGDYRPPVRAQRHRISINGDLSPWFFYLVFLHELAHLKVWNHFGRMVKPHGEQWKQEFASLLQESIYNNIIPDFLKKEVIAFSQNIKASFGPYPELLKLLRKDDPTEENKLTVSDIPFNSFFVAGKGRVFRKDEKLRTRFRCLCMNNKRFYLFHPLANVELIDESVAVA